MKGYGFLSFAKNMGKGLRNSLDNAKKFTTDAIKTVSKSVIQKTAEATGDLIGNKIAHKITSVSKKKLITKIIIIIMIMIMMKNQQLIRKDTYSQEKDSKLLMN